MKLMSAATVWNEASAAVDAADPILLVTHVSPDGDAIGSLLALGNALREQGKQIDMVVDHGVPEYLRFLPGADAVSAVVPEREWPLMISLDASDEERTGRAGSDGRVRSQLVLNIDHHPTNTMFGHLHLVVPEAVSTTEIIQKWLAARGHRLTTSVALPLLTGLVTDTRGFRTSNVTAETLGLAQSLMEAGASLTEVMARTLDSTPYVTVELWKGALPTTKLSRGVISAVITQELLRQLGMAEPTDGGMIDFMISTKESRVAVVFKELADGRVELSLRSKPGYDVSTLALSLGGGGHRQAAGATIDGPLEEAQARVLPLLERIAAHDRENDR